MDENGTHGLKYELHTVLNWGVIGAVALTLIYEIQGNLSCHYMYTDGTLSRSTTVSYKT
jgi:hypothetical protein